MRNVAIALVAVMILFAGCTTPGTETSTGPGTPTGTDAGTPTGTEAGTPTATEGGTATESDQQTNESSGEDGSNEYSFTYAFENASESTGDSKSANRSLTVAELTLFEGPNLTSTRVEIEDGRLLARTNVTQGNLSGTETVYATENYTAVRITDISEGLAVRNNVSEGVTYTDPDNESAENRAESLQIGFVIISFWNSGMDWEQTGTTTVDGVDAQVYESDSFDDTTANDSALVEANTTQSIEARKVVDSTGLVRSMSIKIQTPNGTVGIEASSGFDEDVTVSKPDWVDESQAP